MNGTVSGRVCDETGDGLAGVKVRVRMRRWGSTRDLGSTVTDVDGAFHLACRVHRRNVTIELTDVVGRRLAVRTFRLAARDLETSWVVPRAEASGWIATGEGAFAPTNDNAVGWLIDNEAAWAAVLDAVNAARESIHFLLFFLDVDHTFLRFPGSTTSPGPGESLEAALRAAAGRGVAVRLVLNDFPTRIPDTATVVTRELRDVAGLEMRSFAVGITPIHAKILVVDRMDPSRAAALVIGSPFVQDYFGGPEHTLHDARHGERRFPQKQLNVPVHDVSLTVRGPAIEHLDATFLLHWNHLKPPGEADLPPAPAPPPIDRGTTLQVTRSLGGKIFPQRPRGETTLYESYCRAIANARDFVYLENQYFTLDTFTDILIRAVKENGIELILATNTLLDIPLYTGWQRGQVQRLMAGLTPEERERVGVFTLWTHEAGLTPDAPSRIGRVFIHSKVAVVDDQWATVGSANIDGISLSTADYLRWFKRMMRASDANVVVLGEACGGAPTDLPGTLRRRLWAEHLGLDERAVERPAGGWLGLWNERADAKRESLLTFPATLHPSRALRWPVDAAGVVPEGTDSVAGYLAALGVTPRGSPPSFEAVESFDFYDFETGEWSDADGSGQGKQVPLNDVDAPRGRGGRTTP